MCNADSHSKVQRIRLRGPEDQKLNMGGNSPLLPCFLFNLFYPILGLAFFDWGLLELPYVGINWEAVTSQPCCRAHTVVFLTSLWCPFLALVISTDLVTTAVNRQIEPWGPCMLFQKSITLCIVLLCVAKQLQSEPWAVAVPVLWPLITIKK